jgi:hypothetical protein
MDEENKPYVVGLWYLYSDGSREYVENCQQISFFTIPKFIQKLWAKLTT